MNSIHRAFARHGLVRDTQDNLLGGVCSGLARRFGVDAWAVRILAIASLLVIPGSQIIVYPIMWLLMPDEARAQAALQSTPAPQATSAAAYPTYTTPAAPSTENNHDPLVKSAQ